jgi:hypothetical protein
MKKLEAFTLGLFAISCILFLMPFEGSSIGIIISLMMLSSLYFAFGFAFFNHINLRQLGTKGIFQSLSMLRIIGCILAGISLSVLCIGILFGILHWPGAALMLTISLLLGIIILGTVLFKSLQSKSDAYMRIIIRNMLFIALAGTMLMNPLIFDEIRFRNKPKHLSMWRARLAFENNPTEANRKAMEIAEDQVLVAGDSKKLEGSRVK